jgi:hypothetical protein
MIEFEIKTNNVPRAIIYGYELTENERSEFDYIKWDDESAVTEEFFRYKKELYHLGDIETTLGYPAFKDSGWDGIITQAFYFGILVKYAGEDNDQVIVGRYSS